MKWNELPVLAKDRLVMVYESAGLDAAALASEKLQLDITTKSLQRRIQEHRKFMNGVFGSDLGTAVIDPAELPAHNNHPPSALTDMPSNVRPSDMEHTNQETAITSAQGFWVLCT